jgi:hypothetical protein
MILLLCTDNALARCCMCSRKRFYRNIHQVVTITTNAEVLTIIVMPLNGAHR